MTGGFTSVMTDGGISLIILLVCLILGVIWIDCRDD